MAKVKAPLFSLKATGRIGTGIVYHTHGTKSTVKKLTRPPQSSGAINNPVRPVYSAGRLAYNALDADQKERYRIAAKENKNLTAYTYFMREYIKENYPVSIEKVVLNVELQAAQSGRCARATVKAIFLTPGTETVLHTQYVTIVEETPPTIFKGSAVDIPAGTYDIRILVGSYLARKITNVVVPAGTNTVTVNFTSGNSKHLKAADVNWDGSVGFSDYQILEGNWGQSDE